MRNLFGVTIDVLTFEHDSMEQRLIAASHHDHLLRRFGAAELIELETGSQPTLRLRKEADEIWILFHGSAWLRMKDTRLESPTQGETRELELAAPTRALIPFGVAAGWRPAETPIRLLRLSTHTESESEVQTLEWDEA